MGDLQTQLLGTVRAIWRRRWFIVGIAWVLCLVGWVLVLSMPDRFESRTRIYVDTQTLLAPLLSGITITTNLEQQVAFMQRTLLSRPNVAQVVRMTDLDLTVRNDQEMELLIDTLGKQIAIRSTGNDLFSIAYTNNDPKMAQRVVQSLVNIFVENNLGENRNEMEKARAFLESQIAQYEGQLRDAEQRLAEFKAQNIESSQGNFAARVDAARRTLQDGRSALQDMEVKRDQLKQQLATVPQYLVVDAPQSPQVVVNNQRTNDQLSGLRLRLQNAEATLDAMLGRYTERHPDVIAAKRAIETLRSQLESAEKRVANQPLVPTAAAAPPRPNTQRVPNALYEQIKLRLVDAEAQVASMRRRVAQSEEDLARYEKLALSAPIVEARLADLNRDYTVIKSNYEELLARRESARIAQAVDAETDIQFRIVDPPEVPSIPVGPNRPLFMSIVLAAGLGAGIAFAYLLSQMDVSFNNVNNLREAFGLPVLGTISTITSPSYKRWQMVEAGVFVFAFGCLFAIYSSLIILKPELSIDLEQLGLGKFL